jgi:hypothetical protein
MDASSAHCHCGNYHYDFSVLQQLTQLAIHQRQPLPVSFIRKETGTKTAAATQLPRGFAATHLMTIIVTNTHVTSNSDADGGAADQGMDCP